MGLLDKILGRGKGTQPAAEIMTPDMAEKIVQDYGNILGTMAPPPGCVADASKLPHPKERIKQALIFGLRATPDPQMREPLKISYILLADWQEGVGETPVGLDVTKMNLQADVLELINQMDAQTAGMENWIPIQKKEQQELVSELKRLGFQ